jgi:hypothetical protein
LAPGFAEHLAGVRVVRIPRIPLEVNQLAGRKARGIRVALMMTRTSDMKDVDALRLEIGPPVAMYVLAIDDQFETVDIDHSSTVTFELILTSHKMNVIHLAR